MGRWAIGQRTGAKTHYVDHDASPLEQVAACGAHFVQSDSRPLLDIHAIGYFACPRCVKRMRNQPVFYDEGAASSWDNHGNPIPRTLDQLANLRKWWDGEKWVVLDHEPERAW